VIVAIKDRTLLVMGMVLLTAMLSVGYINATGAIGSTYSAKLTIKQEEDCFVAITEVGKRIHVQYSAPELNEEKKAIAVEIALSHPMVLELLKGKEYNHTVAFWLKIVVEEVRKNSDINVIINEVRLIGLVVTVKLSDDSVYAIYVDPWKGKVVSIKDANTGEELYSQP
jgi:hypothetical protein